MNRPSIDLPRGVRHYEVQEGYAHLVAEGDVLEGLRTLAEREVSHRFLSLTSKGFSCIVPETVQEEAERAVVQAGLACSLETGVSVLRISAPDLRNEPGALARATAALLAEGVQVLHSGDMHDRAYAVVRASAGGKGLEALRRAFGDAP